MPKLPALVPGLDALGISAYQLTLPNPLWGVHGADDGVYLAPALPLVRGAVPYRDYAFVHPPGIAWLMTPLAVFGDTRYAIAAARIVTAIVAGVNASLAAYALRANGRVAMLTAGLALAVFPLAVSADHTLTLDPYLVLFCLLGTVTMFGRGELASPRRILLAGALFGFAGAVKAWAFARPFLGAHDPKPTISSVIPEGACVLFDESGPLIASDRFHASRPKCPRSSTR
jgi:hypothetical protein